MASTDGRIKPVKRNLLKFGSEQELVRWLKSDQIGRKLLLEACRSVQSVDLLAVGEGDCVDLYCSHYVRLHRVQRWQVPTDAESEAAEDRALWLRLPARARAIYDAIHRVGMVFPGRVAIEDDAHDRWCEQFNRSLDSAMVTIQGGARAQHA